MCSFAIRNRRAIASSFILIHKFANPHLGAGHAQLKTTKHIFSVTNEYKFVEHRQETYRHFLCTISCSKSSYINLIPLFFDLVNSVR